MDGQHYTHVLYDLIRSALDWFRTGPPPRPPWLLGAAVSWHPARRRLPSVAPGLVSCGTQKGAAARSRAEQRRLPSKLD
ncbi:uncharacterized protein B0I36DRAFT_332202 [Microdochium trichocladiopsis]|uniref:Uncharacterized protein n=1 Tax=Microdochium trichocladiopsis TaxID=1682393 RepID=A0A9P8XY11_9PEZI|nr:uncharacterized protein B0I36DRAFT_332202 [Microdochium trichocladiopsis]KAH7024903.1 hypothetical protein B0I36DRAFT_332202 [Microdochium trichocladiopsis]